ncbi:ATP-dependent nuclease [Dyadobacter sandarakinus]|uniref:AAA family ATPase n=1 Tax=Dyadobacter sandarakinus TaxID=2747268 RepID=A0ABX7IB00_9BACT|nr:AAA family ATPase [Dyadobacter sandarakinus]QRR02622.1 AAA family ATPase [Dyadobacter sandarakinus]
MDIDLSDVIRIIRTLKANGQVKKYIDFIQFPFYRNVDLDTRINFTFPLTVFIGQNGCGKSTCLHALYGAPVNHTPYEFWFDTEVDPVTYYNEQRKRHSFWYSYKDVDKKIKEVIKARIRRGEDPNYWETSRPLTWAGMKKVPKRNDRDKPIAKHVVYIDFRAELSAFDKFFYFGNVKGIKSKNKQEFIRKKSSYLKKVLSGQIETYFSKSGAVNKSKRELAHSELEWISFISGKEYSSGVFLEHSFFRNVGYSVIFKTAHAEYSEAFAGSGEVAIVRLVLRILDAKDYSLILLDEPEVSLHPGAQSRLKLFLLNQIKLRKHQIVLTSHSPSIIKGLPKEAIKVFFQNPGNGRFLVKEDLTPEEAFYHIEFPIEARKTITVEDILAKEIVSAVLENMGEEVSNLFNVTYNPGGESVIKNEFIKIFCRESKSQNFVIFDGDQKPSSEHFDWRTAATTDLTVNFLQRKISHQTAERITFSVDSLSGSGNSDQQIQLQKLYLDFYLTNVFYLPGRIPEDIIWNRGKAEQQLSIVAQNESQMTAFVEKLDHSTSAKTKFSILAELMFGSSKADEIRSVHKLFLNYWIAEQNDGYHEVERVILAMKER